MSLCLYALGTFRIERDGKPLTLYSRKAESLFAYLVLHPTEHAREKLAALFWGDSIDEQARTSLRSALSDLRKKLGDDIVLADRTTVQINPDIPLWTDTQQISDLRSLTADAGIENLKSKIENYKGDLLSDLYDDWIVPLRDEYRELYLNALLRLIDYVRAQSEYAQVIELGQRVLATDVANETAHQHLIFAYAAQGDRTAALDQYAACERALRDELGVAPSKETRVLYENIKQKVASPSTAARLTNLPNPLTSFIGREKEIETVRRLLADHLLVTLIGAGGSGKTRLAIELGRSLTNDFSGGVWWVDLSPLVDAARVPDAVAKSLGVQEQPNQTMTDTLVEFLRAKNVLLVIDNCEHLIEACAVLVQTLLAQCENVHILATSREGLGIEGEQIYRVPTLATPNLGATIAVAPGRETASIVPTDLMQFAAVRLFVERAKSRSAGFQLNEKNVSQVAHICQRLDGIPLAIELAVARVSSLSVEQIANRLDDRFRLLTIGNRTALPRQQTLRALIDWSFDLLSQSERVLLRRLSVFAGGWTIHAAEHVCSDDTLSTENSLRNTDILDLLARLVNKSLVVCDDQDGVLQYSMLETIREYAREKLRESGEWEMRCQLHFNYFAGLAERSEPELEGAAIAHWLEILEQSHAEFRAALKRALEQRDAAVLRLSTSLGFFWRVRTYLTEGRSWLEQTLACAGADAPVALRAKGYYCLADLVSIQGDLPHAKELNQISLALAKQCDNYTTLKRALYGLATTVLMQRDFETGRDFSRQLLALAQDKNDLNFMARAYQGLGLADVGLRDLANAEENFTVALALCQAIDNPHAVGIARANLALLYNEREDWAMARRMAASAFIECTALRDFFVCSDIAASYATALCGMGDFKTSAQWIGFTQMMLKQYQAHLDEPEASHFERTRAALNADLPIEWQTYAAQGAQWSIEEAVTRCQ